MHLGVFGGDTYILYRVSLYRCFYSPDFIKTFDGIMKALSLFSCVAAVLLSQCAPYNPNTAPVTVASLPAEFCYLDTVAPTIRVDLKYSGRDNFVGRPIAGYAGTRAILRKDTALAMKKAADLLAKQGLGLLVWDAYRPSGAMRDFREWSLTADECMKARFYPNISKQGIYDGKYIGDISEHSWGIAVDITLVDLRSGRELDMGGHHDLLDVSSATESPLVSPAQRANRLKLREAMAAAGMKNYHTEWWHYFLANASPYYSYNFEVRDDLTPSP